MIPGQEKVARGAAALLSAFEKGRRQEYMDYLQELMKAMLPAFPGVVNAMGLRCKLKQSFGEFTNGRQLTGDEAQDLLHDLWDEMETPPIGQA